MQTEQEREAAEAAHNEQMLKVAEEGYQAGAPEEDAKSDFELPEGVSFDDLLAAHKKVSELEEEADETEEESVDEAENGDEGDAETEAEEGDDEGLTEAEAKLREYEIYEQVGGSENYQAMAQWAQDNVPEEMLEVYNMAIDGVDSKVAGFAAQALNAMYQNAQFANYGSAGDVSQGSSGGVAGLTGFANESEMMAAMRDPRYKTDEGYANEVASRLLLSGF